MSLERLDAQSRAALQGLGLLIHGALGPVVTDVSELAEARRGAAARRRRNRRDAAAMITKACVPGPFPGR